MLRCVDLFSGIGGIGHALRGVVTPVVHVELHDDARSFLAKKHPDAQTFADVRDFNATLFKGKIDIVVGGWPCTGFSTGGKGTGFSHEASGLFTEVVRIARECEPKYLFLENSHTLHRQENVRVVVDALDSLGYDCRWLTCRASDVGAKHLRHRWFCLAVKRGVPIRINVPDVGRFDWNSEEPCRQIRKNTKKNKKLLGFLGNAVVPDQVRHAFKRLVTVKPEELLTSSGEKSGYSVSGTVFECEYQHVPVKKKLVHVVLTPRAVSVNARCDHKNVLKSPITITFWPTPVHQYGNTCKCPKTLTKRTSKMLPACVGYSEGGQKDWYLNSDWVRWLMGYPEDYFDTL